MNLSNALVIRFSHFQFKASYVWLFLQERWGNETWWSTWY